VPQLVRVPVGHRGGLARLAALHGL